MPASGETAPIIGRARSLLKKGKAGICIEELHCHFGNYPTDLSALDLLAQAHYQMGATAEAAAGLETALERGAGATARLRCALLYVKLSLAEAALRVLGGLAMGEYLNPSLAADLMAAAYCILHDDRGVEQVAKRREASSILKELAGVIRLRAGVADGGIPAGRARLDGLAAYYRALRLRAAGKPALAAEALTSPGNGPWAPAARLLRIHLLVESGRGDEAIRLAEKLRGDLHDAARASAGLVYARNGRFDLARKAWNWVADRTANTTLRTQCDVWTRAARVAELYRLVMDQAPAALEEIDRAEEIAPALSERLAAYDAYHLLALVRAGQVHEALPLMDRLGPIHTDFRERMLRAVIGTLCGDADVKVPDAQGTELAVMSHLLRGIGALRAGD